jgi:phosphohistidine phosphatase
LKQLFLIRHAKSDWSSPGLDDINRPLNERGKKDAPEMAERLKERKVRIDEILSSPAKRAAKTAKIFAEVLGKKKDKIRLIEELYMAEPATFYEVINDLHKEHKAVAIFSHNNGLTDFANMLTATRVDNIPTCGIFAVKAHCSNWNEFKEAQKEFLFFDYPKLQSD